MSLPKQLRIWGIGEIEKPDYTQTEWIYEYEDEDLSVRLSEEPECIKVEIEHGRMVSEVEREKTDIEVEDNSVHLPFFGKTLILEPGDGKLDYEWVKKATH